ncbi:MAG: hypothetical protein U1F43_31405 [Myxococcota bacterium]
MTWTVDGVAVGSDSVVVDDLVAGWNAVTLPMSAAASGGSVAGSIRVAKPGLADVAANLPAALVVGPAPSVTASLATRARVGETLTCVAAIGDACTGGDPVVSYDWTVDGVLQSEHRATFATAGLDGGESIACKARLGLAGGGFARPRRRRRGPSRPAAARCSATRAATRPASRWRSSAISTATATPSWPSARPTPRPTAPARAARSTSSRAAVRAGRALGDIESGDARARCCGRQRRLGQVGVDLPRAPAGPHHLVHAVERVGLHAAGRLGRAARRRLRRAARRARRHRRRRRARPRRDRALRLANGQYLAGRGHVLAGPALTSSAGSPAADSPRYVGELIANGTGAAFDGAQGVWQGKLWSFAGADYAWDGHNAGFGLATGDFDGDGVPDLRSARRRWTRPAVRQWRRGARCRWAT